jgi:hypothetical protein
LQNNELVLLAPNEDLIPSSSSFIYEENLSEPRSADLFIIESHTPICVSAIYRDHFFEYVSELKLSRTKKKTSFYFSVISFIQIIMVNLITKVHLLLHSDVVIKKQLPVMYAKLGQLFGI